MRQWLWRARATRPQDQADFDQVAPHLVDDARTWLIDSLMTLDPEHIWISMLKKNSAI
jgi:hypothetical protein